MKRMIKANNSHQVSAERAKANVAMLAEALARVARADSDEEARDIASGISGLWSDISDQYDAIKTIGGQLTSLIDDYLDSAEHIGIFAVVKDDIINLLQDKGYPMTPVTKSAMGISEAYEIVSMYDATQEDLLDICKLVQDYFDIKSDQPLGGSWTAYNYEFDGIRFKIGFAPDFDEDPSGNDYSIQLMFK